MHPARVPGFLRWSLGRLRAAYARERRLRRIFGPDRPNVRDDVEIRSPERLEVGPGVVIDSHVLLHCGGMEWSGGRGRIRLGANVYLGPNAVLFGAGEIDIGDDVLISPNVTITSHQHARDDPSRPMREQPSEFRRVTIGRDVWIGSNAAVLPGVTIGEGAVIGAGAVVCRDVPAHAVAVGVPARVIRRRDRAAVRSG